MTITRGSDYLKMLDISFSDLTETVVDQETRLTAVEENIQGNMTFKQFMKLSFNLTQYSHRKKLLHSK